MEIKKIRKIIDKDKNSAPLEIYYEFYKEGGSFDSSLKEKGLFLVIMKKETTDHSYFLGIYTGIEKAIIEAKQECTDRAGKYNAIIYKVKVDSGYMEKIMDIGKLKHLEWKKSLSDKVEDLRYSLKNGVLVDEEIDRILGKYAPLMIQKLLIKMLKEEELFELVYYSRKKDKLIVKDIRLGNIEYSEDEIFICIL
tara:strand:+ start:2095 stop:2679 length:585 start_codon:yes stop_codon:yes gene_type:complete